MLDRMMSQLMGGGVSGVHEIMHGMTGIGHGAPQFGDQSQTMSFSSNGGGSGHVAQSYSYSSVVGPDGRPVIRETRHSAIHDGANREERYEHYDSEARKREAGLARAINDRSVTVRKVSRDEAPDDVETHTEMKNLDQAQLGAFDSDWERATAQNPLFRAIERVPLLPTSRQGRAPGAAPRPVLGYQGPTSGEARGAIAPQQAQGQIQGQGQGQGQGQSQAQTGNAPPTYHDSGRAPVPPSYGAYGSGARDSRIDGSSTAAQQHRPAANATRRSHDTTHSDSAAYWRG